LSTLRAAIAADSGVRYTHDQVYKELNN